MKRSTSGNQQKKTFLRIPTFPGGKEAYLQFIRDNIVYPEKAVLNKVEGSVYLVYTVNNLGEIADVEVTKGIGYGCDEEAVRLIRLMKYEPARNRGVKMKAEMKTRINFILQETFQTHDSTSMQLNYIFTNANTSIGPDTEENNDYSYTINL